METIKKYKTEILVGAGAIALTLGIYHLFFKKEGGAGDSSTDTPTPNGRALSKLEKANIIAGIKVERDGQHLTVKTISQIGDAVIKFAIPQFIELTQKDREERRAAKNNFARYVEIWDEYTKKLEEIVDTAQKEVLKELQLDESVWENSNSYYISQNNHELFMLHATLPQRLKGALQSKKKLTEEEFKAVLRAQVTALQNEAENVKEFSNFIKHPEEIAPIVQNRVNDYVYEQFQAEEEDILACMHDYMQDPEVQSLMMQIQQATMRLMPLPEGMF